MNKLKKDKRGVFGLTAVQSFFAIVLGLALLAYVIIVIMGTLGGTAIIPKFTGTYFNDTVVINNTGVFLTANSFTGGTCGTITSVTNMTGNIIAAANYTQTGCSLKNSTQVCADCNTLLGWKINYPYTRNTQQQDNLNDIAQNTSAGVSGFFSSINPVYAILAVLVIILVLVVLVRVVQAPASSRQSTPQLL
jgi:hypothetical protein